MTRRNFDTPRVKGERLSPSTASTSSACMPNGQTTGREHAGIIIVSSARIPTSVLFTKLMSLQSTRGAAEMRNALIFISPSPVEEKT